MTSLCSIQTRAALCCVALVLGVSPALSAPPYAEEWITPNLPEDVDVDPFGRVWVSCDDDSIHVYAPTGGEHLFAIGGTGTGDGEFQTPYGIAFDATGNAYICDYLGARLEKFDSDGNFLLSWPIPSTNADHVTVDAAGDVYVSGYTDFSVHKYTAEGVPLLDWVSPAGEQNSGVVAVDGFVFVAQWSNSFVEQYATDGTYLGSFDASTFGGADIESDTNGQLWVCDFNNHVVRVFAQDGTPAEVLGSPGSGPGEFSGPIGVAQGLDGSIYVADYANGRVQRFGDPVTGVEETANATVTGPRILGLAPNPCLANSELTFALPIEGNVVVTLNDVSGRTVATLTKSQFRAGTQSLWFSPRTAAGRPLAAGTYFVRLATSHGVSTSRLVVLGR